MPPRGAPDAFHQAGDGYAGQPTASLLLARRSDGPPGQGSLVPPIGPPPMASGLGPGIWPGMRPRVGPGVGPGAGPGFGPAMGLSRALAPPGLPPPLGASVATGGRDPWRETPRAPAFSSAQGLARARPTWLPAIDGPLSRLPPPHPPPAGNQTWPHAPHAPPAPYYAGQSTNMQLPQQHHRRPGLF